MLAERRSWWSSESAVGPTLCHRARFDEVKDKWPDEAWSLVVDFRGASDESLSMIADVSFLMPEAPVELLHTGSTFELFEGAKVVATGEVL